MCFVLTPGQTHDVHGFGPLFRVLVERVEALLADKGYEALLADKGYDADAIRAELAKANVEAVIPAKRNRRTPIPHDRQKYRWRNPIERLFAERSTGVGVRRRDRPRPPVPSRGALH